MRLRAEMAVGVDRAVECWMSEIEQALTDIHLTSLGRLNAVREIVDEYKHLTGKVQLKSRTYLLDGAAERLTMDVDLVYSYLIDATWFFLGSWVVLLLTAGIVAFIPLAVVVVLIA